jgi:hypothetical protein
MTFNIPPNLPEFTHIMTLEPLSRLFFNIDRWIGASAVGGGNNANRLINAKKTAGKGVEFNLELLPMPELLLTLSGSVNDVTFRDGNLQVEACGNGCTIRDRITVPADPANFKFAPTVDINGNQTKVTPDAVRVRKKELAINRRERREVAIEEAQAVE